MAESFFELLDTPIDPAAMRDRVRDLSSGGYVAFEGWVRNHNEGKAVDRLSYEAYASMARAEAERIMAEALERFEVKRVGAVHREGDLELGDMAVWVGVSAAHRAAAFEACRYVIDEIKARLPIWKKEHYSDGTSEWVLCSHCHS